MKLRGKAIYDYAENIAREVKNRYVFFETVATAALVPHIVDIMRETGGLKTIEEYAKKLVEAV